MAKKDGITYEQIIGDLQKKIYKSVYFLMGEEPYYIDKIADYIEKNVLDKSAKDFNQIVLYGGETSIADIINFAKGYPLSSDYKVIIVKEAQNIKKEWENLSFYLQKPLNSTILVFCYKYSTPDGRLKWFKEIEKNGVVFISDKLRENQMQTWVDTYARSNNIEMDNKSIDLLCECLGTDLTRILNAFEKLISTLPPNNRKITTENIECYIGISKDFNVFELEKALTDRDALKANRIVQYFAENKKANSIQQILAQLFNFFVNILHYHYLPANIKLVGNESYFDSNTKRAAIGKELSVVPFPVAVSVANAAKTFNAIKTMEILGNIRKADARSKGFEFSENNESEIYKELIYNILH
ncbi:MAG: DNA polymerase III subunit delta [Paludibacter sp.]|nr:DNA polymerase III subunit delta [Paludibacter sp.]